MASNADVARSLRKLRAGRGRPCGRRTAEQSDKLAASNHSITSSARAGAVTDNSPTTFANSV
jgi:hypothetical protein